MTPIPSEIPLEITPTDDGLGYFVSLTRDGITAKCFVSSMHLTDEKRRPLERAIDRMAAAAYTPSTHPIHDC